MHVVLVPSFYGTPTNPVAGAFFRDQAQALHTMGVQVGVVAVPEKAPWQAPRRPGRWPRGLVWEDDAGVATVRGYHFRLWPGYHRFRLDAWVRFGMKTFTSYVQRVGRPDLVHVHVADPAGLLGAEIKRQYGIPMVLTEHATWLARSTKGRGRDRIVGRAFGAADAGIVVSPRLGELLTDRLPSPPSGWRWIPNVLDARFLEVPLPTSAPRSSGFAFLSVGWLVPRKGYDVLLRAFAAAFSSEEDVTLRIAGSGPTKSELRDLAKRLGVGDRVRFLGALSREQVVDQMSACNAVVLSSLFETFGVVVIEALAVGRPVVATRCGGPEYILDASTGVIVEPGNVDELAGALRQIYARAADYRPAILREYASTRYGPKRVAGQLIDVYREVLGSWRCPNLPTCGRVTG